MIKFINFSPKLLAIASYYTQILVQFDKFSLFFLSPHSYAKLSIKYNLENLNKNIQAHGKFCYNLIILNL